MKWWCLFLIRDDAGKDIVEEYFRRLNVLTASTSWKVRSAANHLLPLMPYREIHFAILPFLQSTCEELEVSWKSSKLGSFQSDFQRWLDDIARLKDTYHFPSQPSPAEGASAAKRIDDLLDNLPTPGTHILEIIIDRRLFSDLDVKANILLYGSLFRAYMWHHAAFRPLGVGSNGSQLNTWLNDLGVTGSALQAAWLPVWKGCIATGNSTSSYHFELQCSVPVFELTALNKISAASEEKSVSEEEVVWSSCLEVLEEFSFSRLPMHLVIPIPFRLVPTSTIQTMAAWVLKCHTADQESCVTVRLSYWDDVEMKTKPSKPSCSEWQRNLLMERPLQSASVGDQCLQKPSGHLHFILLSIGNMNLLFPLRKTPSTTEMCLYSGRQSTSSPPVLETATCELLQDIPLVRTDSILDSVHHNNSLRLALLRNFIASGQSSSHDVEELEKSFDKMSVDESDWVIDASGKPSVSPPDHVTYASLGDPSDWPERRFLVSESLKSSASGENCTLSNAGGSPGHKVLSISAGEIIKLFDESGRPKRKPLHPVHAVGQSTKPSVSRSQVESTYWPDVLQCKYHDMYYNTDSEVLESSCCAMKEQCLVDETATTCTSSLESSTLPQSKSRKPSSKACVPVCKSPQKHSLNKDRTTLRGHQQKHSFSSTRNDHVASASLRRSPRKASSTQNMPRKPVPRAARNSPQAAASPFLLRRSPRKSTRKYECDDSRREAVDVNGGSAAEKLRMKLRVAVANALEKNGVSQSSPLYKPCGKKLFAICSTFAKDLVGSGRTSELLQKIADSHAKQVVKFEVLKPGRRKSETLGAS